MAAAGVAGCLLRVLLSIHTPAAILGHSKALVPNLFGCFLMGFLSSVDLDLQLQMPLSKEPKQREEVVEGAGRPLVHLPKNRLPDQDKVSVELHEQEHAAGQPDENTQLVLQTAAVWKKLLTPLKTGLCGCLTTYSAWSHDFGRVGASLPDRLEDLFVGMGLSFVSAMDRVAMQRKRNKRSYPERFLPTRCGAYRKFLAPGTPHHCPCADFRAAKCFATGCAPCPLECLSADLNEEKGPLGYGEARWKSCDPCCTSEHGEMATRGELPVGECCTLDCPCADFGSDCHDWRTGLGYVQWATLDLGWLDGKNFATVAFFGALVVLSLRRGQEEVLPPLGPFRAFLARCRLRYFPTYCTWPMLLYLLTACFLLPLFLFREFCRFERDFAAFPGALLGQISLLSFLLATVVLQQDFVVRLRPTAGRSVISSPASCPGMMFWMVFTYPQAVLFHRRLSAIGVAAAVLHMACQVAPIVFRKLASTGRASFDEVYFVQELSNLFLDFTPTPWSLGHAYGTLALLVMLLNAGIAFFRRETGVYHWFLVIHKLSWAPILVLLACHSLQAAFFCAGLKGPLQTRKRKRVAAAPITSVLTTITITSKKSGCICF
eukprot:g17635.t1